MAYKGNKAKIPLGEFGLLTDIAPDKAPPNSLIHAKNIQFVNGMIQKAAGAVKWNATALPASIVGCWDWNPDINTRRMIAVTEDGSIYKGRDRVFNQIGTGLGKLTPNCTFASGGNEVSNAPKKLFIYTAGATIPKVLLADADAVTDLSKPATDWNITNWPKCGVIHRNRNWAFAGQIAYASSSADHEDFQNDYLAEPVYPGEGGEIRGAFIFKSRMFVFKDEGFVYGLNDSAADTNAWFFEKVSSNSGLSAPNGIAEVLNNVYFGNSTGTITDFAATEKLGSVEAGDLIQNSLFESHLRGNTSKVGVTQQHLLYYAEKKMLFATYRSAYYTYNDMLLVFDFSRIDQVRVAYWIKGSPQCLGKYKDVNKIDRPMYGSKDGYLMLMDYEDRTEGGASYSGEFQTPHLDFSYLGEGFSSAEKHFDHLAVHYVPESTGDLFCDYFIDGHYVDTIRFTMVQHKGPLLSSLKLGTDRLASPTSETCIRPLAGSGRTFSAKFYQQGSNQSFQIPAVTVFFRGGGEKAQQEKN